MQMAFNSTVLTVLKTIVWLSLMSNFVIVLSDAIKTEESDIYCLKSIKDSLEDPYDYLGSSWNFGNSSKVFICDFTGIDCWNDHENRAMGIRLPDRGLKGQFPRGISNCTSLQTIDLSGNKLVGIIPYDIWRFLPYVVSLDLSANSFSGEIPPSIASLRYLNILKLDDNRLTGQIPHELGLLPRINSFSVANNLLSGPVPDFGSTSVTTAESYANNKGLCGGPLKRCKAPDAYDHAFFLNGFAVGCSVSTVVVFALTLFYLPIDPLLKKIMSSKKKKRNQPVVQLRQWRPTAMNRVEDTKISKLEKLVTRISFTELVNTTDNFREDNIIGLGKTGIIYKAVFPNGSILAIKRFFNSQRSKRLFMSEVMTLGRLRHTNLVPLIGFCYETMEKLLVYKYMPNGNLYDWLHPPASELKIMKWPVRVKIAVGLARGLAWLHHYNRKLQVFHQNISSKCVLLDKNFEPKISNFGKAKFMSPNNTGLGGISVMIDQLLDLGFKKKDVYSFGVVLLELVTGRETFDASANSDSTSFCLHDAVDNALIGLGFDDEIFEFLSIACKCIQSVPEQRPTMLEVYQTMRATGVKHGLVDDSVMWNETKIATASRGDNRVYKIGRTSLIRG
ncbi:probably inactive leucine-rich repeat receptor-like protein kinase At5g48380 isoform X1 [Camellia sinensis]|uniref:probably inactive leucine-rich repeat receptor-like protein kinase At5g48380 isoform X1 n=1 Tax=Camellia sinensis TaxID=4442 RepID=UPI00103662A6|nr:probably inactive leucine-rich repeat receptor-like protein kinase At5g48380 isoform X1 [Camellia sinensis]